MRRRVFLAAMAAGVLARPSWADLGAPRLLAAANDAAGRSWLLGLSQTGEEVFRHPIPARGHAAAAHPVAPVAVAFARRPGRFAVILDCRTGQILGRLEAPEGRHFYGHGAYTRDGGVLLTTENAFDDGTGRIGLWDANNGYRRIGDAPSGGVGPHEILRLPDGGFAVANGGIRTHPDFGRARLNLPDMRPSLTYLAADGRVLEQVEPPEAYRQNSIRHLDADASGRVFAVTQWQGAPMASVPLVAMHLRGEPLRFLPHEETARLKHYAGSVAVSADGARVLVTGPKGDRVLEFDGVSGAPGQGFALSGASGVAALPEGMVVTYKDGLAMLERTGPRQIAPAPDLVWDNHLVRIRA